MPLPSPDPVAAAHQLIALREYAELDDGARQVVSGLRDGLHRSRAAGDASSWLAWYHHALTAVQTIQQWLQAARSSRTQPSEPISEDNRLARIKDSQQAFVQRWNVRLQDQTAAVRTQLLEELAHVYVGEFESALHLQFAIPLEVQKATMERVHCVLDAWAEDVAHKLTPSWHSHLLEAVRAERLVVPGRQGGPPAWPRVRLKTSAMAPLRIEATSTRRPTLFRSIWKEFSQLRMLFGILTGGPVAAALFLNSSSKNNTGQAQSEAARTAIEHEKALTLALAVSGIAIAAIIGIVLGYRGLGDELAQVRHDHEQRQRAAIHSYITATVESFRSRMQTLIGSVGQEARSRLGDWLEAAFNHRPTSSTPVSNPDVGTLLMQLNSIRGGIATRIAQLELEQFIEPAKGLVAGHVRHD